MYVCYLRHACTNSIFVICSLIQFEKNLKPLRPYERHDTLKQFLEHDSEVLRFCCFWDDRETMFGDLRELKLLYFLSDDTIEIQEVFSPNSGRDTMSKFFHRSKLPKVRHFKRNCSET